ncbi:SOS-response repressor and protease LexA [hydrothermal vent metagenome]|uniref:SOS-response repressor and protease LexA n=1 Tax=hydrothermal vent metagenome TaxID=652676 RepID=A0A3B1AZH8_9ZZZZ
MSNIHLMIPKNNRPLHIQGIEPVEIASISQVEIPLLGRITAGNPIEAIENRETVPVPANMARKESYALRVVGTSMIEDNIEDGDIIVVQKKETAENGQSVVAKINNETVTLKKFYVEPDGVRLQPANAAMRPIYLRHDQVEILGIVTGVIRLPG